MYKILSTCIYMSGKKRRNVLSLNSEKNGENNLETNCNGSCIRIDKMFHVKLPLMFIKINYLWHSRLHSHCSLILHAGPLAAGHYDAFVLIDDASQLQTQASVWINLTHIPNTDEVEQCLSWKHDVALWPDALAFTVWFLPFKAEVCLNI
jgi:hypothetical protein